jgi:hypothetical protein
MAWLVAFVGVVHMACVAFGAMDTLALAASMDFIALESPFSLASVVHGINREHGIAHTLIQPNLAAGAASIGDLGCICLANIAPQRCGID